MKRWIKVAFNKAYIRKWELKIGVNSQVLKENYPDLDGSYSDLRVKKDTYSYSDRYKNPTTASKNFTTVPANCITLKDPLHIEATIKNSKQGAKTNINKANIKVYNLSDATAKSIKVGSSIFLKAGYETDNSLPHLFIGQITNVTTRPSYQNTITEIFADSTSSILNSGITRSYPPNSSLKNIVDDLSNAIGKSGMPLGGLEGNAEIERLLAKVYPSGYVAQGSLLRALETVCSANGLRVYTSLGRLHIEPTTHKGGLTNVLLIEDGQFKGKTSEKEEKKKKGDSKNDTEKDNFDLELDLFLNGNITINSLAKITAKGLEGTYDIKEVNHELNWKKGDWDTKITLAKIDR